MPELPSSDIHEYLPSSMLLMIPQGDYASGIDPSLKFNDFGQPISESFGDEMLTTGYQIESTQYLAKAPKSKVQKETEKKLWNNLLSDIQKAFKEAGGYLAEIADYVILDDVKQALKNLKDRNFKGLIWNGLSLSPWGKSGKKIKEAWEVFTKEVADITKKRRAQQTAANTKKATQGSQAGSADKSNGNGKSWLVKKSGEVDWRSTPNFGHTFSTHGQGTKNTKALLDRAKTPNARGEYVSQGQWLNNQKAAEYLNSYGKIEYANPPIEIKIPKGLAQVIHPDGTITEATKARIVINQRTGKIRSAIPIDK